MLAGGDVDRNWQLRHVLPLGSHPYGSPSLYFPATHGVHVPPSGPSNPRLHVQVLDPGGEPVFAMRQFTQTDSLDAAVDVEYLPETQLVHSALPGVEEYLPVPHSMHLELPVIFLNVPTRHCLHHLFQFQFLGRSLVHPGLHPQLENSVALLFGSTC
jgi:hypothetical protein